MSGGENPDGLVDIFLDKERWKEQPVEGGAGEKLGQPFRHCRSPDRLASLRWQALQALQALALVLDGAAVARFSGAGCTLFSL